MAFVVLHLAVLCLAALALGQMFYAEADSGALNAAMAVSALAFLASASTGYSFALSVTGSSGLAFGGLWLLCLPCVNYIWVGWLLWRARRLA